MKKEVPILYSTPMVQAKLAWRKSQTRRILKHEMNYPEQWKDKGCRMVSISKRKTVFCAQIEDPSGFIHNIRCPYGQPGDLLWGRESVLDGDDYPCSGSHLEPDDEEYQPRFLYKADCPVDQIKNVKWTPSIHMPKEAARIWDEITGIRVERIASISEEDCIAEGIEIVGEKDGLPKFRNYTHENSDWVGEGAAYGSYRSLWQSLNGTPKLKGGRYEVYPFDEQAAQDFAGMTTWRGKPLSVITNPWVWVVESQQISVTGKP